MKNIKKTGHKTSKFLSMVMHLFKRHFLILLLDWEEPLEKEMATHSRALAWKIP